MSTIAVVGVTGYAGGRIAAEALRRGHEVVGIARSASTRFQLGMTLRAGDLADTAAVAELAAQASALVVATRATENGEPVLLARVPALLEAAAAHGTRLGFVGGAGSLLVGESGPRLVDTPGFPDLYRSEALSHAEVLEALRASASPADWFYVSPAAAFGGHVPGERTGRFRIGGDHLLTDADGTSFISGADFAIAVVDEIDRPAHHRERFSVAY